MSNKPSIPWSAAVRDMREDRVRPGPVRQGPARLIRGFGGEPSGFITDWRGHSGRRYVVAILPLTVPALTEDRACVALAVAQDGAGQSLILRATTDIDPTDVGSWINSVRRAGATELHVHLLAENAAERAAIVQDLTAPASRVACLSRKEAV